MTHDDIVDACRQHGARRRATSIHDGAITGTRSQFELALVKK
jgi:hypothetical protein